MEHSLHTKMQFLSEYSEKRQLIDSGMSLVQSSAYSWLSQYPTKRELTLKA